MSCNMQPTCRVALSSEGKDEMGIDFHKIRHLQPQAMSSGELKVHKRVAYSALRLLSIPLLIYAGSAFLSSASAGVWLMAIYTPWVDPSGAFFSVGGSLLLAVGIFLAVITLVFLVISFRRLGPEFEASETSRGRLVSFVPDVARVAYLLLVLALLLVPLNFVKGGYDIIIGIYPLVGGGAALTFLVAVSLPALSLGRGLTLRLTVAAIIIGVAGVVGLSYVTPLTSRPPTWVDLGGFPLLNWNLPFGTLVGVSTLLLWFSYRMVVTEYLRK